MTADCSEDCRKMCETCFDKRSEYKECVCE